jgi:formylglycine-generating enzyme required for sulfatase activity
VSGRTNNGACIVPHFTTWPRASFGLALEKRIQIEIKDRPRIDVAREIQNATVAIPSNDHQFLYVSKFPITNEQYAQFLLWLTNHDIPIAINGKPIFYNDRPQSHIHSAGETITIDQGYENHPVTFVNWIGASVFSAWIGGRLPTNKEWETYICPESADIQTGNNTLTKETVNFGQFYGDTTSVGTFPPNTNGVYDALGNVSTWTLAVERRSFHEQERRGLGWNHTIEKVLDNPPRP